MRRHQALQPLSREHHHFLLLAREIRWQSAGEPRRSPRPPALLCAEVARLLGGALAAHMAREEAVLLPLLDALPAGRAAALRLQRDHAALRAAPDAATLAAWGRLLHDHIRWEERTLFQALQRSLSEPQLGALALRLNAG